MEKDITKFLEKSEAAALGHMDQAQKTPATQEQCHIQKPDNNMYKQCQ